MRVLLVLVVASWLLVAPAAKAADAKNALVLYSNSRLLPANIAIERGMQEAIRQSAQPVELYSEFFDVPRFSGDAYVDAFATYLRDKYVPRPPDVIVASGKKRSLPSCVTARGSFRRFPLYFDVPKRACGRYSCRLRSSVSRSSSTFRARSSRRCAGIRRPHIWSW
jgi:hypothetical protein